MPTPNDPPRVAVEVTRDELAALADHHECYAYYWAMHDPADERASAYHRAREAELRKVMEGMDG